MLQQHQDLQTFQQIPRNESGLIRKLGIRALHYTPVRSLIPSNTRGNEQDITIQNHVCDAVPRWRSRSALTQPLTPSMSLGHFPIHALFTLQVHVWACIRAGWIMRVHIRQKCLKRYSTFLLKSVTATTKAPPTCIQGATTAPCTTLMAVFAMASTAPPQNPCHAR